MDPGPLSFRALSHFSMSIAGGGMNHKSRGTAVRPGLEPQDLDLEEVS